MLLSNKHDINLYKHWAIKPNKDLPATGRSRSTCVISTTISSAISISINVTTEVASDIVIVSCIILVIFLLNQGHEARCWTCQC